MFDCLSFCDSSFVCPFTKLDVVSAHPQGFFVFLSCFPTFSFDFDAFLTTLERVATGDLSVAIRPFKCVMVFPHLLLVSLPSVTGPSVHSRRFSLCSLLVFTVIPFGCSSLRSVCVLYGLRFSVYSFISTPTSLPPPKVCFLFLTRIPPPVRTDTIYGSYPCIIKADT